jgi:hypothetical protein
MLTTLEQDVPLGIEGRHLDDPQLWNILLYASVHQTTIESACTELTDTPSGNTVREHLQAALGPSALEVLCLEDQLNAALHSQLPGPVRRRLRRGFLEVGLDLVEIPYQGKPASDPDELRRGKAKAGTTHFHTYATLAIVHHGGRYELALTFVWAGETMAEVVERLLHRGQHLGVQIRRAYLDKGFAQQPVYDLLQRHHLPYLIPLPRRGTTGGVAALCRGQHSYRTTHTFNAGTARAYTAPVLLIRHRHRRRGHRPTIEWFPYTAYGLDHIPLTQIFALYRRRFGMESGYRQLHDLRARTTSPNPTWRLLFVGLGLLLYNLYILLRRVYRTVCRYGRRTRVRWLSLTRLILALSRHIEQLLGITPIDAHTVTWRKA